MNLLLLTAFSAAAAAVQGSLQHSLQCKFFPYFPACLYEEDERKEFADTLIPDCEAADGVVYLEHSDLAIDGGEERLAVELEKLFPAKPIFWLQLEIPMPEILEGRPNVTKIDFSVGTGEYGELLLEPLVSAIREKM